MEHLLKKLRQWLGAQPNTSRPPVAALARSGNVLVIDDELDYLHSIKALLEREGFHVWTAGSGVKGLSLLRYSPEHIDVVLLDYRMPQLDGAETLEHLRRINPRIKVIAVTGVEPAKIPDFFTHNVDQFLSKPCSIRDIVAAIHVVTAPAEPASAATVATTSPSPPPAA